MPARASLDSDRRGAAATAASLDPIRLARAAIERRPSLNIKDDRKISLAEIPRMAPPVADDGSTKGVRTTLPVVNRRARSGSAACQADRAIENPTH